MRLPVKLTDSSGGVASQTLAAGTNLDTLTDSTGGTPATTLAAVPAGGTGAAAGGWDTSGHRDTAITAINSNFASVKAELALQQSLNTVLLNHVASLNSSLAQLTDTVKGILKRLEDKS